MKRKFPRIVYFLLGFAFLIATLAPSQAQEYYQGKTVTFIVGTAPGGGFDTYTRMIARYFGKYIPGAPNTVVQNMTGAGTLIAANHMYNKAKPDGLTIGLFSGSMILKHVLGDKTAEFDGKKFGWLGTPAPERHACVLTDRTGIKSFDEWIASKKPLRLGSLGPGNATSAFPELLRATLGLPIKVIEGFKGTSDIRLAAEAGEVDGACWGWDSIKATWAKAIDAGTVKPIVQTTLEPHPDLRNVPVAIKYVKTKEGSDLLKFGAQAYGPSAIAYSVPPGTPNERLIALQRAFLETLKDPEFLAESQKARLPISPIDGPTITKIVSDLYAVEPALLAKFKEITEGIVRR